MSGIVLMAFCQLFAVGPETKMVHVVVFVKMGIVHGRGVFTKVREVLEVVALLFRYPSVW